MEPEESGVEVLVPKGVFSAKLTLVLDVALDFCFLLGGSCSNSNSLMI